MDARHKNRFRQNISRVKEEYEDDHNLRSIRDLLNMGQPRPLLDFIYCKAFNRHDIKLGCIRRKRNVRWTYVYQMKVVSFSWIIRNFKHTKTQQAIILDK